MPVPALLIRFASFALLSLLPLGGSATGSLAQPIDLPRCPDRPTSIQDELYVDNHRWCPESIVHDKTIEALAFTALAVAPDGSLYAARPLSGQVMVIRDTDGDTLPDAMETFAAGLELPNGLAYYEDALYVAGGAHLYRVSLDGEATVLADDLPSGIGFWTGGLAVGDDDRLYVAIGAPCDDCAYDEPDRGVILSMDRDGGDRQILASGFRNPADVAFFRDQLWTLDSAPYRGQRIAVDELNRVQAGGWYGFPYCLGAGAVNIAADDIDCAGGIPPALLFGSGANPSALAAYPFNVLPGTADTLIVVLSGEPSQIDIVGYKVIMITFDAADLPLGATVLIPYRHESGRQAYLPYHGDGLYWEKYIHLSELGFGFYPQQPLAVAVSPQGWIYISLTGGRIVALRPRLEGDPGEEIYPIWTPMHSDFDPSAAPPNSANPE